MVPAEMAIELATIHRARALGLENEISSLEVGKKVDLVLIEHRVTLMSGNSSLKLRLLARDC